MLSNLPFVIKSTLDEPFSAALATRRQGD